jgi:hypothetical protein
MKVVALRRRPTGGDVKPPHAAWLKTVVVSDEEKAQVMRQVGIGKTSASEPLLKCRKDSWHQNRGENPCPGMSLAGVLFLARRCPA